MAKKNESKNPFKEGERFHLYYEIFVGKVVAPSDSDLVKQIYKDRGYLVTIGALRSFRSRLRTGTHPHIMGTRITDIALQPHSCSQKELDLWIADNVT